VVLRMYTRMWKQHIATLHARSVDLSHQSYIETKVCLADKLSDVGCSAFTVLDVVNAAKKPKVGEFPSPGSIHMQAFQ